MTQKCRETPHLKNPRQCSRSEKKKALMRVRRAGRTPRLSVAAARVILFSSLIRTYMRTGWYNRILTIQDSVFQTLTSRVCGCDPVAPHCKFSSLMKRRELNGSRIELSLMSNDGGLVEHL